MKKQNQTNKLGFNKTAVAELNDNQMSKVDGGNSLSPIRTTSIVVITILKN